MKAMYVVEDYVFEDLRDAVQYCKSRNLWEGEIKQIAMPDHFEPYQEDETPNTPPPFDEDLFTL